MARNMTLEKANEYMSVRNRLSQSSKEALNRRYKKIAENVRDLCAQGRMTTTSPANFTVDDFVAFVKYRQSLNKSASDLNHYISAMNQLMLFCGNGHGEEALRRNPDLRPQTSSPRKNPLPESVYDSILGKYEEIDKNDFHWVRAYALVLMYIGTGCRNKELRLAEIGDLDTDSWTLRIRHPKGETSYAGERLVLIPEELRPIVKNYLEIRWIWLRLHKVQDSGALFFALDSDHGFLSGNSVRRIKDKVASAIGFSFELRDCRRTYGQRYLDHGADIQSVSKSMGHKTTRTTELYYARIADEVVLQDLRGKWSCRPIAKETGKEDGKA